MNVHTDYRPHVTAVRHTGRQDLRLPSLPIAALLVVLTVATHLLVCGFWSGWDDAFITYRFAEYNATGNWFHWNANEPPVNGVTSSLWLVLMTASAFLGLNLPVAAIVLGLGFHALSAFLAFRLLSGAAGVLAGIILAVDGFGLWATVGMETWLYVALLLAAVLAYDRGSYLTAAALGGLLCMARLDGFLLPVLLALDALRQRRVPWKEALVFGAIVVPWLAAQFLIYGSILPSGMVSKQVQADVGVLGRYTLVSFEYYLLVIPYGLVPLAIAAAIKAAKPALYVLLSYAILSHLAYTVLGIAAFPWYYVPALACLWTVASSLANTVRTDSVRTGLVTVLAAACAVLTFRCANAELYFTGQSDNSERQLAAYLAAHSRPGETLATESIGIIGYYNPQLVVHDILGIVCPEMLPAVRNRALKARIETMQPDWIFTWLAGRSRLGAQIVNRQTLANYSEIPIDTTSWPHTVLYRRL